MKEKIWLINISKHKKSIAKLNYKTVVISILDNFRKKGLPILILEIKASILNNKKIDVIIIDINTYWIACKLKKAQVFAVSIRDLEYQREKEAKPETHLKTIVPKKWWSFRSIF